MMDDWKLLELAFDILENAKEGEVAGSRVYLSVDRKTWDLFKAGIKTKENENA